MDYVVMVNNLRKVYKSGDNYELEILKNININVRKGELIAIVGESGSGKSTLFHIIGTLDLPTSGEVIIDGFNPFKCSDTELSLFRARSLGFIFQQNNLLPEFSALDNVIIPGLIAQKKESVLIKKAKSILDAVGLSERFKHFPGQLSGGEQQRVAIARSLINDPVLILADEPSGNLDSQNAQNIHDLFVRVNKEFNATIMVVTHNRSFAFSLPKVLNISDGIISIYKE